MATDLFLALDLLLREVKGANDECGIGGTPKIPENVFLQGSLLLSR